ncbi:MAG: hypothetical protein M3R36_10565 [Bacteroidota bacterium]|nr:hypothetical protein [Bacteroidota bacterium]
MKDKQRFMSSVIVSLLAGFIYYQFGQDIQQNFERSIKSVLSSNDMEEYLPADCESFNSTVKKSGDSKITKKKSKFFIKKKNTIEFKSKDAVIAGEELFSDFVSGKQANFRRPVPDKNIDFTAELEKLMKNEKDLKPGKEFKANKSYSEDQVADSRELRSNYKLLHKDFDVKSKYYRGNGFEYNLITDENSTGNRSNGSTSSNGYYQSGTTYEHNTSCDYSTSYEYSNAEKNTECKKYKKECVKKIKIVAPKVEIEVNTGDEVMEIETPEIPDEISVPDENKDSDDETM